MQSVSVHDLSLSVFVSPAAELIGLTLVVVTWIYAADLSSFSQLAWSFIFLPTFVSALLGFLNVYVLRRWHRTQTTRPMPLVSFAHAIFEGLTFLLSLLGLIFILIQDPPPNETDKRFRDLFVFDSVLILLGSLTGLIVFVLLVVASRAKNK